MDYNEGIDELWEWQEEGHSLRRHLRNDTLQFSWNEENLSHDTLMYMLDGQTPIKECMEFVDGLLNIEELNSGNETKVLDECIESSLVRSRRMLQYDSNNGDDESAHFQPSEQPEVREELDLDYYLRDTMQWATGFSGDGYAVDHEGVVKLSEGCVTNYSGEMDMSIWCSEMMACDVNEITDNVSDHQNNFSLLKTVDDKVIKISTPSPRIKFKCKGSSIQTPAKVATSVVYPFTLVKPSGSKGDITLNDINQWIHSSSFLNSHHVKDDNALVHYPTSTFSGKPVVAKTKIRTEGGKGSIIIMRTKG